ncbi:MAG: DegT/DnrJ/EryC1/StrS family aminotransferase [Thermoplasmata archaeon]
MNVPIAKPIMTEEMVQAAADALRNEKWTLGESVTKFEEAFAKMCGTKHAVAVNSGTAALQLALESSGIKAGDRVLTSAMSFVATANSYVGFGGIPGFVDILEKELTIDPSKLRGAIDEKTKAVIPVHLYGHPARMDEINESAKRAGLLVVEDACQAHGAWYKGKRAGNLADVGCFSFYPSKNMHVGGDGGMITTNDDKLADMCRKMRNCGRKSQYEHDVVGYTMRMNTVNAAVGLEQLKHLDEWNEKRRAAAKQYEILLRGVGDLVLPPQPTKETVPVFHLYTIRTKKRNELKAFLESKGVGVGVHYEIPIHLQPIYRQRFGFREGLLPITERMCNEVLVLPMFADITGEQIKYVSDCIKEFFSR